MRNLEQYFHESLKKDADFTTIPVSAVAREADVDGLSTLVELVAAAAVTCENKSEYVSRIMSLSPESQVEMKGVLESGMGRLFDFEAEEYEVDENEMVFGDNSRMDEEAESKNLFEANHLGNEQLEQELAEAKRELAAFKSQAAIAAEDKEKALEKLRAVVEDLQDRLLKRQDELIQVEEDLQQTTAELEDTKSKLAEAEEQKAQLADDLDVATAKTQQLHKAEATLVAYKKKLESVGGMNQQMTDLEDQAANYLRQIMELENQVKKSNKLQKEVDELQEQVTRLEKGMTDNEATSKSAAAEIAELKSQLSAAERSKKMFEEELMELRAKQEVEVPTPVAANHNNAQSAEDREKAMRLQIENQKLQEEIDQLKKSAASAATAAAVAASEDDSAAAVELKKEIARLQEELAAKEKENAKIAGDKDKLEAYTKRTLAKFQDKYLVALQECKAKLKEKQDKIEALENRSASERTAQKREERLLSSTIYELGMAIMQNRLKER